MILLLVLVRAHAGIWRWIPGLLLFGAGVGTMLTSSVNVVQSSFPDRDQGEISGLSRSVSNLGSSSAPPSWARFWSPSSCLREGPSPSPSR